MEAFAHLANRAWQSRARNHKENREEQFTESFIPSHCVLYVNHFYPFPSIDGSFHGVLVTCFDFNNLALRFLTNHIEILRMSVAGCLGISLGRTHPVSKVSRREIPLRSAST